MAARWQFLYYIVFVKIQSQKVNDLYIYKFIKCQPPKFPGAEQFQIQNKDN